MNSQADQAYLALKHHAQAHAAFQFKVTRDETDSYALSLDPLGVQCPAALEVGDLHNLLPTGTSFRRMLGARSWFGSVVQVRGAEYVAVGVQDIVKHETRGAFPESAVYLYLGLEAAAQGLLAAAEHMPKPAADFKGRYGILSLTNERPDDRLVVEPATIRCAAHYWNGGSRFLFRTLLIDQSTLRLPGHPGPPRIGARVSGARFEHDRWLIGVTPAVRADCDMLTKAWMRGHQFVI
jgi:hypothetical protein